MARSAPGKHHRRGITLAALFEIFPDDVTAERWFAERRWHGTIVCRHCGYGDVQTGCAHKTMPYRCRSRNCRKRFSTKTGTVMEASNVGTHHDMSRKHLHRYVSECTGRHNTREMVTENQMDAVAVGMVGKRVRYAELVGEAEPVGLTLFDEPW